jgi:hypothetical protein
MLKTKVVIVPLHDWRRSVNKLRDWREIGVAGGFTTEDVGRLLGIRPKVLGTWLRGERPLVHPDYEPINGSLILSFDALVEARAIAHFLEEGIDPGRLRQIMEGLRSSTGKIHPLASDRKLVTDGFRLLELTDDGRLVNLANEVYAHDDLIKPALIGRVIFEAGKARYFLPDPVGAPLVRVDPRLALGRPVVFEPGKRIVETAALAAAAEDEGLREAADWFDVSIDAAHQALQFERRLAA